MEVEAETRGVGPRAKVCRQHQKLGRGPGMVLPAEPPGGNVMVCWKTDRQTYGQDRRINRQPKGWTGGGRREDERKRVKGLERGPAYSKQ